MHKIRFSPELKLLASCLLYKVRICTHLHLSTKFVYAPKNKNKQQNMSCKSSHYATYTKVSKFLSGVGFASISLDKQINSLPNNAAFSITELSGVNQKLCWSLLELFYSLAQLTVYTPHIWSWCRCWNMLDSNMWAQEKMSMTIKQPKLYPIWLDQNILVPVRD